MNYRICFAMAVLNAVPRSSLSHLLSIGRSWLRQNISEKSELIHLEAPRKGGKVIHCNHTQLWDDEKLGI